MSLIWPRAVWLLAPFMASEIKQKGSLSSLKGLSELPRVPTTKAAVRDLWYHVQTWHNILTEKGTNVCTMKERRAINGATTVPFGEVCGSRYQKSVLAPFRGMPLAVERCMVLQDVHASLFHCL